jgi:hypothetical protein
MILTTTFIPSQRAKDLMCALWAEYHCCGETHQFLIELRSEIGKEEFARFEKDMQRMMWNGFCARRALGRILRAAVLRSPHKFKVTKLPIHQPA